MVVGGALLTAPTSHADVPSPYFATSGEGSDPHMIRCTDPSTGTNGYCLYTSVDMGQSYNYPDGCEEPGGADCANWYPMEQTKLYYSTNGYSSWTDKGAVFHENTLETAGWVPSNAYHLWAPAALFDGSYYQLFIPDVEDVSTDAAPNIHTSSRIAVARATSPFGPYTYQGLVDDAGEYMSDPHAFFDGTNRVILWANGDFSTCGGFSAAQVESDWRTTVDESIVEVNISGVEALGSCDPDGSAGPIGRPYMEGASVYKVGSTFHMYFAVKPDDGPDSGTADDIPKQCTSAVGGPNSTNSVIAWATSSSYSGTYTYKGVIMCGSTTEWTNQATISTATNGRQIIVFHDAGSGSDSKKRNLHAECLFTNGTITAVVYPQAQNVANGFDACMAGTNADYWGLHAKDPDYPSHPTIIRAPSGGTAAKADRYAVGPHERFKIESLGGGIYAIKALSNSKYLCTPDSSTAVTASCTSTSDTGSTWGRTSVTGGGYRFQSRANSKYLSVAGNQQLYASATGTSTAAVFNFLYAGGKSN